MRSYYSQQARFLWKLKKQKNLRLPELPQTNKRPRIDNFSAPAPAPISSYNGPVGFKWDDSSCASDSLFVMLIYGCKLVKRELLQTFNDEFPGICDAAHDLINDIRAGWRDRKGFFLNYVRQSPTVLAMRPGDRKFLSILDVFTSLFSRENTRPISETQPFVYSSAFDVPFCHRNAQEFMRNDYKNIRILHYHEFTTVENCIKEYEITHLPVRSCSVCGLRPCTSYKHYNATPVMLFLRLDQAVGWLREIDREILFGGDNYTLVGAVYGNGQHFKTRFQVDIGSTITHWEYDGNRGRLNNEGARQCLALFDRNKYPVVTSFYEVDTVLYIKTDCFKGPNSI